MLPTALVRYGTDFAALRCDQLNDPIFGQFLIYEAFCTLCRCDAADAPLGLHSP
jgi:hypothetical protein